MKASEYIGVANAVLLASKCVFDAAHVAASRIRLAKLDTEKERNEIIEGKRNEMFLMKEVFARAHFTHDE